MVTAQLIHEILRHYRLGLEDIHGISHWARVMENGRRLTPLTGANLEVVELFAVFHDARRVSNGFDLHHGKRGAELAEKLRGVHFELPDAEFALLSTACLHHAHGRITGDVTVRTCWDSDRLDLARAYILPDPDLLCTDAARQVEMMAWANKRSQQRCIPALVKAEWGIELGGGKA